VRVEAVVVARVEVPVTAKVPATPRRYPGVVDPTPTFPLARIVKSDAPVDEATLNGLVLEVEVACTLKTKEDDVALIPATTPLSRSVDVPSVVDVSQRVAKPVAPVRDAERPRVEVATQRVLVPVACNTIPRVPVAEVES
jgi:hypothetical protein